MVTSDRIAERLLEARTIVATVGCTDTTLRYDGNEVLLEGCVPSFEIKLQLEAQVRQVTGAVVRNCLRVLPV